MSLALHGTISESQLKWGVLNPIGAGVQILSLTSLKLQDILAPFDGQLQDSALKSKIGPMRTSVKILLQVRGLL